MSAPRRSKSRAAQPPETGDTDAAPQRPQGYDEVLRELVALARTYVQLRASEVAARGSAVYDFEGRAGRFNAESGQFESCVSEEFFAGALEALRTYAHWDADSNTDAFAVSTEIYYGEMQRRTLQGRCDVASTLPRASSFQKKRRVELPLAVRVRGRHYDMRFALKEERPMSAAEMQRCLTKLRPSLVRVKERCSFLLAAAGVRFDLTRVYEGATEAEACERTQPSAHEIEVEHYAAAADQQHDEGDGPEPKAVARRVLDNLLRVLQASSDAQLEMVLYDKNRRC